MTQGRRAIGAVLWSAAQQTGGKIISFAVFIVLSRLLDAPDFGVVAMAAAVIAFLQLFATHGFGTALVQKEKLEHIDVDTAFWGGVLFNVVMLCVAVVCAPFIARLFSAPELASVISWLSLAFVFAALSQIPTALLQREFAFRALAVRGLIAAIVGGAVGVGLALYGFGVWSLVAKQLVGAAASVLLLWGQTAWRPRFRFSVGHFRSLFLFGAPMGLTSVVDFLAKRSDDILIGYFLGATALGYYTIAYRIIAITTEFCVNTINSVAWPFFARMQEDLARLRESVYLSARGLGAITYPVFMLLLVGAPELIHTVFGAKWNASIHLVQILAFAGMLNGQLALFDSAMVAMGRTTWRLVCRLVLGIANLFGFAIAVHWGLTAVALSFVVVSYAVFPLFVWFLHRLIRLNGVTYLRQQTGALAAAGGMAALVWLASAVVPAGVATWILLCLYGVGGIVAYVALLWVFAPTALGEVRTHVGRLKAEA